MGPVCSSWMSELSRAASSRKKGEQAGRMGKTSWRSWAGGAGGLDKLKGRRRSLKR